MMTTTAHPSETTWQRWSGTIRWASILLMVASLLLLSRSLPLGAAVDSLKEWIESLGWWGPAIFALVYVLATVLFVPGLILTIAAGAIFGLWVGTITVSLGSTTGAALAFLIARHLARHKVAEMVEHRPRARAVDRAIGEGGWKIVALLRLSPVVPFNLQNYLYGLTPISFWPCVLASWVAMLPGTFMYVYIGHLAGAVVVGERQRTLAEWIALAVGLLATVAVTVYITRLASRRIDEQTELDTAEEEVAEETPAATEPATVRASRPWATLGAALAALLLSSLAVYAQLRPDRFRNTLTSLFGPPEVELGEAYEAKRGGPTFDHSTFDELLGRWVDERGFVDYRGLDEDRDTLRAYLRSLERAPFSELGRDEKLALLINAYNAFTLELILEHYPVASIRDIPAEKRWEDRRWKVGENTWSLNQIEHEQIRPKFEEPRIHFALVCAAVGCPPLRQDAYVGSRIDEQLEEQTLYVHRHERWFRYEAENDIVHLTELYNWYAGDFEQVAGSILDYVARYSPALRSALDEGERPEIRWISYDWSLNAQNRIPAGEGTG